MANSQLISNLVIKNFTFLKKLCRTNSNKKREELIKCASFEELLSLVEISLNVLKQKFVLTTKQKKRLLPFAEQIRKLSSRRSIEGARKTIQIGGGAFLVTLLAPVVWEIAKQLIKNE